MKNVKKEIVYGMFVYEIQTDNTIPYQLTFQKDLFFDRTNVNLLPHIDPEKSYCKDLRQKVCYCFEDYLECNTSETLYFAVDISYNNGALKLVKFIRWMQSFKSKYLFDFEITDKDDIRYAEIRIKNI